MKKHLILILSGLISIPLYSQDLFLQIQGKKIDDAVQQEERAGGKRIENNFRYMSGKGISQPVRFTRKQNDLPNLITSIFSFEKDSTIYKINYEWHDDTTRTENNKRASSNEINAFVTKYKDLRAHISKVYGESNGNGNLENLSAIDSGHFERRDKWETKDSTEVELYMVLSSKYEKNGAVTKIPTYRINLDITNLSSKSEQAPKLTDARIENLNGLFQKFLSSLQNNQFDATREQLADVIKDKVSSQQLQVLRDNINFKDSLVLFASGMQMGFDGTTSVMLQYRYKKDTAAPPSQLIKVIFDDKDRILGIQPTRRM